MPFTVPANFVNHVPYDELVNALRLVQHATAPTHDDGAYHENAHDIASGVLSRIDARAAYESSLLGAKS